MISHGRNPTVFFCKVCLVFESLPSKIQIPLLIRENWLTAKEILIFCFIFQHKLTKNYDYKQHSRGRTKSLEGRTLAMSAVYDQLAWKG